MSADAASGLAVRVRGLRKVYGDTVAVADVSFDVRAGEIFGLLGPNGSGKTTTVECPQGLRRADGGDVDVLGLDPRIDAARVRRLVGSQLQDSALPARLKCGGRCGCSRCSLRRGRRGSGCSTSGA